MWDRNRDRQSEIRNCWCFGLSPQKQQQQQQQEAPASHAVGVPCSSTRRFRRPSWSGPSEPALKHSHACRPPSDAPRPFILPLVPSRITLGFLASAVRIDSEPSRLKDAEAWLSRRLRSSLQAQRHGVQLIRLSWDARETLELEPLELLRAALSAALVALPLHHVGQHLPRQLCRPRAARAAERCSSSSSQPP